MSDLDFDRRTFTAPLARRAAMVSILRKLFPQDGLIRLLDLGCGTGSQALNLAAAFPRMHCVGIDISGDSIERACALAIRSPEGDRVQFLRCNYLTFEAMPFDVIIADSVLQNIFSSTTELLQKLGRDLRSKGFLVASMPYDCPYNRVLWGSRRLLRALRGPWLDALIEVFGKKFHKSWDPTLIRERIPYMYLLPARVDGEAFRREMLALAGLELVSAENLARTSPAQPKHRLLIFQKKAIQ